MRKLILWLRAKGLKFCTIISIIKLIKIDRYVWIKFTVCFPRFFHQQMEAMFNSTTCSTSDNCSMDDGERKDNSSSLYVFYESTKFKLIIVILAPIAVAGNALILAAIWKKTFEKTSFHILLSGLAFADLCSGLVAQPLIGLPYVLLVVNPRAFVNRNVLFEIMLTIGFLSGVYFGGVTMFIITLMSVERWLVMTQRTLMTSRRRCFMFIVMWLIPIPLVVLTAMDLPERKMHEVNLTIATLMLICYLITSVAYFKVFRIIRQHQQQVQGNQSSQNFGQPAINLAKYKRSVVSILYILALFSLSFLPMIVSLLVHVFKGRRFESQVAYDVSLLLLFSSSSLNPCLYLWRMNDVRVGVKKLFCTND